MSALATMTTVEWKLFRRDGMALFFGLAFPPALLLALGAFIPGFQDPNADIGGQRPIDLYLPIVIGLALATLALSSFPTFLATYREKGILRRLATTPVGPAKLLGAQLLLNVGVAVVAVILTIAVAVIGFDVEVTANPSGFLATFVVVAAAMFAVGLVIAAVAPRASVATGIGMAVYFPALFFAGVYFPRDAMSGSLRAISDATPIGSGVQAMQDTLAGYWPQLLNLAVLVIWIVIAGIAAVRLFKWE